MAYTTATQITDLIFSLSRRHRAVGWGQHDHPTRACQQVRGVGQHPRASGELTEDEHSALLDEIRVQASQAVEGVLPHWPTLQEKTSARSLYRVAAWTCRTSPKDGQEGFLHHLGGGQVHVFPSVEKFKRITL